MEYKINRIVQNELKLKIKLPVIAYCSEGFDVNKQLFVDDEEYVDSSFYQTSKLICYLFYKPLYLVKKDVE